MSRTFSKIMLICALVVIVPLMIVGTAFASYYSVTAEVNVAIAAFDLNGDQIDNFEDYHDAYVKVLYNAKEHQEDFKISDSHMKTIPLKASANGLTFKGWYKGKYAEYVQLTDPKYASEELTLEMEMSKYDDVLAVFEINRIVVSYNYEATPGAAPTTVAPAGYTDTYAYGQALPTLAAEHYTFKGWADHNEDDNGDPTTLYRYATFTSENPEIYAVWQENAKFQVTYKQENGTVIATSDEVYVGETLNLADPTTLGVAAPATGKRYVWKINGVAATQATATADAILYSENVIYTATFSNNVAGVEQRASIEFTVDNYNTQLASLFEEDGWNTEYSFWNVTAVKVGTGATEYNTVANVWSAVTALSAHEDYEVELTPVLTKYFTQIAAIQITYGSYDEALDAYSNPVYYNVGADWEDIGTQTLSNNVDTTTSLAQWLTKGWTLRSGASATAPALSVYRLVGVTGVPSGTVNVSNLETINDFIEYVYSNSTGYALSETFTLNISNGRLYMN